MKKIFSLTFLIFVFSLIGCSSLKEPEYKRLDHFRFEVFTLSKIIFKTDLVMYNPNRAGLNLLDTQVDVYVNDKLLGHSSLNEATRVNRISEFSLPLTVQVNTSELSLSFLKKMWDTIQAGKVKVTITGSSRIKKFGVPINFPINYSENVALNVPSLF